MKRRKGASHRANSTEFLLSQDAGDTHSNWAISYGDMVTLLLSFFVMFFGVKENTNFQRFKKSIEVQAHLGNDGRGPGGSDAATATATKPTTAPGTTNVSGLPGPGTKGSHIDAAWATLSKLGNARFIKDQQRLVVEFPNVSFFEFRDVALSNPGKDELATFAKLYAPFQTELKLIVIGYTDSVPVRRARAHRYTDNLELSALRGVSAVRYLIEQGVSQTRMRFGGEGEWHGKSSYDDGRKPSEQTFNESMSRKVVLVVEAEEQPKK